MNRNGFRTTSRVLLEFAWSLVLDSVPDVLEASLTVVEIMVVV